MSNELEVFGSDISYEEIAKELGANVREERFPVLRINKLGEDEAGHAIPVGSFMLSQGDKVLYSKTAVFRLFLNCYQYLQYDSNENKFVNKSLVIKNFFEEAHDQLGGLKCGKVKKELIDQLSDAEKEEQKQIKCYRLAFGTVMFPDQLDHTPCLWRTSGDNFNNLKEPIQKMEKMKHLYPTHVITLALERQKRGSNVWYHANADLDLQSRIPFTEEDLVTLNVFKDFVDRENRFVSAKWREAKKLRAPSDYDDKAVSDALGFDDEIPF